MGLISDTTDNGAYWSLPLAGFANPRYLHGSDPTNALGFSIAGAAMIVMSFENGFTATVIHEQTLDPTGVNGWFPVLGKLTDSPAAAPASAAVTGKAYIFAAQGVKHRVRVTALTVADIRARIFASDQPFDIATGAVGVSGAVTLGAGAAAIGTVTNVSAIAEDVAMGAASTASLPVALEGRNTQKTSMSATGDKVNALGTMDGRQVVKPYSVPEVEWRNLAAAAVTTAVATTMMAAGGAGIRGHITSMQLFNSGAVATEVQIRDGAAGTVLWRGFLAATVGNACPEFPIPLRGSAATLLEINVVTPGGAVWWNVQGYQGP